MMIKPSTFNHLSEGANMSMRPFVPLIPELLFHPGKLFATPIALKLMQAQGCDPWALLRRYVTGDWGPLSKKTIDNRRQAIAEGRFIAALYNIGVDTLILVYTGPNHSCTMFETWEPTKGVCATCDVCGDCGDCSYDD